MDEKQLKALEWLNELEQYAKEQKLSLRILDSIDDCKKQITTDDPNWNDVNAGVEDLLKSIERKTVPDTVQTDKNKDEVSIQAIKTRVTKMAEQCHIENESSLSMMTERKNAVIKKIYGDMQEISHTKAHLSELTNEDLYLDFFQKIKREYEKNVFQMIQEMLSDISNNYKYMLEHMRSMFQSIGGYKNGLGNEKFYHEYASRKDGIDKKIQSEVESSYAGGRDILLFGQKTKDVIKSIVKKLNRKRKILIWMPLLLLLLCFSLKAITSQKQCQEVIENAEVEAEKNDGNSEVINFLVEKAKEAPPEKVGSFLSAIITFLSALMISLGALLLFIVLLIIVLYAAYIKILKLWCNHQIRKQCGEYLKTELIQFEQNNTLMPKLEEAMKTAVEEYESQYLAILNSIFSGTNYDMDNTQNEKLDQFTVIKKEWNALR